MYSSDETNVSNNYTYEIVEFLLIVYDRWVSEIDDLRSQHQRTQLHIINAIIRETVREFHADMYSRISLWIRHC